MFVPDSHREKDIKAQSSQRRSTQGIYPVRTALRKQPLRSACSRVALMGCSGWFVLVEPSGVSMLLKPRMTRAVVYKAPVTRRPWPALLPGLVFRRRSPKPCRGPVQPVGSGGVCVPGLALPAAQGFLVFHSKSSGFTVGSAKAQFLLLTYLYLRFKVGRGHARGFRARLRVRKLLLILLLRLVVNCYYLSCESMFSQ